MLKLSSLILSVTFSAMALPAVAQTTTPAPPPIADPVPAPEPRLAAPTPAPDIAPAPAPAAVECAPGPAYATPPYDAYPSGSTPDYELHPPTGIAGIIVGFGGFAVGAAALVLPPICLSDPYHDEAGNPCAVAYGVVAVGGFLVAAIGLSLGFSRRVRYKAWRARQHSLLDGLDVASNPDGAGLQYRLRF